MHVRKQAKISKRRKMFGNSNSVCVYQKSSEIKCIRCFQRRNKSRVVICMAKSRNYLNSTYEFIPFLFRFLNSISVLINVSQPTFP